MIPNFNDAYWHIAMFDNTNKERISISENIENNIGSTVTTTDLKSTATTIIITIIVLAIFIYIYYKLSKHYKAYVLKHVNRVQNA